MGMGPAQPRHSTTRNPQEWRATETVLAPPGRAWRDPVALLSPLVRSAGSAAAQAGEQRQLGRFGHFPSTVQAYQSPSHDWRRLHQERTGSQGWRDATQRVSRVYPILPRRPWGRKRLRTPAGRPGRRHRPCSARPEPTVRSSGPETMARRRTGPDPPKRATTEETSSRPPPASRPGPGGDPAPQRAETARVVGRRAPRSPTGQSRHATYPDGVTGKQANAPGPGGAGGVRIPMRCTSTRRSARGRQPSPAPTHARTRQTESGPGVTECLGVRGRDRTGRRPTTPVPGPMTGPTVGRCAQGGPWGTDQPRQARDTTVALPRNKNSW
jgi:hypothetical protein